MRKFIIPVLTLIAVLTLCSGLTLKKCGEYGPWKHTSYIGLDYCVKKCDYNQYAKKYEWYVKFKNSYLETIHFNCAAKESSVLTAKGTDRFSIRSGKTESTWFLVADANAISVFVDCVRIGKDDSSPYYNKDNKQK